MPRKSGNDPASSSATGEETDTRERILHAANKLFDLPQGKILVLDRAVIHDVEALQESAFLLTVASAEVSGH